MSREAITRSFGISDVGAILKHCQRTVDRSVANPNSPPVGFQEEPA